MKKNFFLKLYYIFLLLNFCFAETEIINTEWIKGKDDDHGFVWTKYFVAEDTQNKYPCLCVVSCFSEEEIFQIGLVIWIDEAEKIHPAYTSTDEEVIFTMQYGNKIKVFHGRNEKHDEADRVLFVFFHKNADDIARLLLENTEYDFLIECKDWRVHGKIIGNLPIQFDERNPFVMSKDGKKIYRISGLANLENYETLFIPTSVNEILNCSSDVAKEIYISKSVEKIHFCGFASSVSLERVFFADPNTIISFEAFQGCKNLKYIDINRKNCFIQNDLLIIDGILNSVLNSDSKIIIIPPNVTLPPETELGLLIWNKEELIISNPSKIDIIDFDEIGPWAYESLKSITCPKSVKIKNLPTTIRVIRN